MNQKKLIPRFTLLSGNEGKFHVSYYVTKEAESSIAKKGDTNIARKSNYHLAWISYRIWKHIFHAKYLKYILTGILRLFFYQHRNYIVVLMGPKYQKCFPHFFRRGLKAIYLFDAWPNYYEYIIRFINDFSIDYIFVSSQQSTEALNNLLGKKKVYWIPEAVKPEGYKFYRPENKDIDVLYFGRKYQLFHEKIVDLLSESNTYYLYASNGKMVFPDSESLIEGLARAKISICFPTNTTHNDRAGDVETMTNRYLQSMVSKCLVLGKAPREMIEIFGYNPVVEVDMDNPAGQIIDILKNYDDYTGLIDKNYLNTVEKHSWEKRGETIFKIILQ